MNDIEKLITDEKYNLELKEQISFEEPKKYLKAVSSFANGYDIGYVIFGVEDEEFEKIYLPVCINYDNYLKEFIIPDVVAFYLADNFYKKVLSKASLYNYINSAIDVFNVRCDIDELISSIKKILIIKYNLKIVKDNPMILKKYY